MNTINLYTHYSPSHEIFYKTYFKPTLRKFHSIDEIKIRLMEQSQYTINGKFMEAGWLETMQEKIQIIQAAIEENWGSWFIFSDCDIQFFKPFLDILAVEIKNHDLVAQEDIGSLCAGFFACQSNKKMKDIFQTVFEIFRTVGNDQAALNKLKSEFNYGYLNKEQFYTIGNELKHLYPPIWNGKDIPKISKNMHIHHANFVVGIEQKLKLMQMVKNIYENLD